MKIHRAGQDQGKTIATVWNSYLALTLPRKSTPGEAKEARRAFYAGAYSAIRLGSEYAALPPHQTDAQMLRLIADLEEFEADVAEGTA